MYMYMSITVAKGITAKLLSGVANKFTAKLLSKKHVGDPCFHILMFRYRLFIGQGCR